MAAIKVNAARMLQKAVGQCKEAIERAVQLRDKEPDDWCIHTVTIFAGETNEAGHTGSPAVIEVDLETGIKIMQAAQRIIESEAIAAATANEPR